MQTILNETEIIKSSYQSYSISQERKNLVEKFMNSATKYLLGRNEHTKAICEKIKIDYIIDDFAPEGTVFENIKVVKCHDVPKDAIVVNCVLMAYVGVINEKLLSSGINSIIPVADFYYTYPELFKFPLFTLDTRKDFSDKTVQWQEIFDNLADSESKKVLKDILMYRLTAQSEFLSEYKVRIKEQYFEDFLNLKEGKVFVDCGGFEGETTEEFIKRCPQYSKVYLFEPSHANIEKAKINLKNYKNIEYFTKGVSDKEEILKFSSGLGSASIISEDGDEQIEVVKIDDCVKEKYTFLKMDLEGWEMNALRGAENSIKKYLPKLAITPYHQASDFYDIYSYIKSLNPNYKVYLRHYTQGWIETVMFFV